MTEPPERAAEKGPEEGPEAGPGIAIGPIVFDPTILAAFLVVSVLAVGLLYLLRNVLLTAPEAAFPLLFTVLFVGLFLVAWWRKR